MREFLDRPFEVKEVGEDGAFTGYGSVFGNVDSYGEVIVPGAFNDSLTSLKAKGRQPAMLWQHRSGEPIGVYTHVAEDGRGLLVSGKLAMKTTRGAEAHELLKIGALSGLSIGFITREDSYDKLTGVRTLKRVDLWEVSLVTFPANDEARVSAVKQIEGIQTLADAENHLREVGGYSKSQALAVIARIKSIGRGEHDEMAELKAALIKRGNAIQSLKGK